MSAKDLGKFVWCQRPRRESQFHLGSRAAQSITMTATSSDFLALAVWPRWIQDGNCANWLSHCSYAHSRVHIDMFLNCIYITCLMVNILYVHYM